MKFILLINTFLLCINLFSQCQIEKRPELWTVLTTGNVVAQNAHEIVSKEWGINVKMVAGDVIDEKLIEEVEHHNVKVWNYLKEKGIKNPRNQYYLQVKNEQTRLQKILELVSGYPLVVETYNSIERNDRLDYVEITKKSDIKYKLFIYSFDVSKIEEEQKLELKLLVDIRTARIKIIP